MAETTTFDLWGGIASVSTVDGGHAHAEAVSTVHTWVAEVDRAASTYRADSEITALNDADGSPTLVGPVLAAALRVALDAAARTVGVF